MRRFLSVRGMHYMVLLGSLCILLGIQGSAKGESAKLALDELIAGMDSLVATWHAQPSWMIHFRHTRDRRPDAQPDRYLFYTPHEIITARKGSWFYGKDSHELMELDPEPRPNGQMQTSWYLWRDNVCIDRSDDRYAMILPEPSVMVYQLSYYTGYLWLDLQDDMRIRSASLKKIFLTDRPSDANWRALPRSVINHKAEFRVRPQLEDVEGAPCYVLERPEKDIIWIDAQCGFVCRRRLYYQEPGYLHFELRNHDFQPIVPGIWLPREQEVLVYNIVATCPPERKGKIGQIQTNTLVEARFDLPDSFFTVPIPDRCVINDYIRGVAYVKTPEGSASDVLAGAVSKAKSDWMERPRRSWVEIALWVGTVAGMLLLFWQCYRLRVHSAKEVKLDH